MSFWEAAESARVAALAARDAFWRIRERHKVRMENDDRSLLPEFDEKRRNMTRMDIAYNNALSAALKSGEKHPEEQ